MGGGTATVCISYLVKGNRKTTLKNGLVGYRRVLEKRLCEMLERHHKRPAETSRRMGCRGEPCPNLCLCEKKEEPEPPLAARDREQRDISRVPRTGEKRREGETKYFDGRASSITSEHSGDGWDTWPYSGIGGSAQTLMTNGKRRGRRRLSATICRGGRPAKNHVDASERWPGLEEGELYSVVKVIELEIKLLSRSRGRPHCQPNAAEEGQRFDTTPA